MRKIIHKLRQKPPHVRDQIAVFGAMAVAGVVALFWMVSITNEYASPETKTSFKESFSPFKIFGNNVKSALDRSKAELSSINPYNASTQANETEVTVDQQGVVNLGVQE